MKRNGNVAVVCACCLVVICGIVALCLDGGQILDHRRHSQSAADAAAIAAADELYLKWWANQGADTDESAKAAAVATAKAAGYVDGVNGCSVTVNIPPVNGLFVGQAGYAEVIITAKQTRNFSKIWSNDTLTFGARAVARGQFSVIKDAITILDPTEKKGTLNANGQGTITVTGAPIQVNSTDSSAMIANGSGKIIADGFNVAGSPGYTTPGGGSFTGPIVSPSPQIEDPLQYLPPPDPSTLTVQSGKKLTLTGKKGRVTLSPGIYTGGISITGQQDVVLEPGIYYMDGGGFNWSGQGGLTATGVMIYNASTNNSDAITISGTGNATMSPPMDGPYKGISLFQNRYSSAPVSVSGADGATMTITGTFYAAAANLQVTGNGTQQTLGSQYISYNLNVGGQGTFNVVWESQTSPGQRFIMLVE